MVSVILTGKLGEMQQGLYSTRTTRTPAFWDPPPPPPHDYPYKWFTSDPKSKEDKVKVTNFKKFPKIQILQEILHATHLLILLDKMYKYEMDPTRTVGATEWTWNVGRTDGRSETNIPPPPHPPQQLRCEKGIINTKTSYHQVLLWSNEAPKLFVNMIGLLWKWTGILAALLLRCLSNFRVIDQFYTPISQLQDFARSNGKIVCFVIRPIWKILMGYIMIFRFITAFLRLWCRKHQYVWTLGHNQCFT